MQIQENISLKPYNSFAIESKARYFANFSNVEELAELADYSSSLMILGGGSNVLFKGDYNGLVLKNEWKGMELVHEDEEYVYIKAGAGENWHGFVMYCIENNWAGVENLALIPGNIGASPMQNIGAYGTELSEIFWSLDAFHLEEKKIKTFTPFECEFGYRESVFKGKLKDQFVILTVTYRLRKKPRFNTRYGAIEQELEQMGVKELTIRSIAEAVIRIRSSKLPDPKMIGNAGSFFKNPVISKEKYEAVKTKYEDIIGYENVDGTVKLAAGWLIEHCGPSGSESWKGYRKGDAGCHAKQALVLVNYGHASGKEILDLSEQIAKSVEDKFDVLLEREVNVIG